MGGETLHHFGTHLETARADSRADGGEARLVACPCHRLPERRDHPGVRSPPSGVGHTHRLVRFQDHPEAIGGEDGERETGNRRPEGVELPGVAGAFHPDQVCAVDLPGPSPLSRDVEGTRQQLSGIRVLTQIAIAPVVSAQVDPRDAILLDENLLDNARSVEHPTPIASWDRALYLFQQLLGAVSP